MILEQQQLIAYWLISIGISIIKILQMDENQILAIIRLCLTGCFLITTCINRYKNQTIIINKVVLLLEGVLTFESYSILQFFMAEEILRTNLVGHWMAAFKTLHILGLYSMVILLHRSDQLLIMVFVIHLQLAPQVIKFIRQSQPKANQNDPPKMNYMEIRTPLDDNLNCADSIDLPRFLSKLSQNTDTQFAIKELKKFQETLWKRRMNAVPVGIAFVTDFKITHINNSLQDIFNRYFYDEDIKSVIMERIKFRRIESNSDNLPHSGLKKNRKKSMQMDDESLSMSEIFQKLDNGSLNYLMRNQTLELFASFLCESENKQIYLDCRVFYQNLSQLDHLIIIQDCTKQHELQKLTENYEFKNKVIQSFSHELRTPLNSAILFLQGAISEASYDLRNKYLGPAYQTLMLQKYLIDDIIDFSQINAGIFNLKISLFDIQKLIDDITAQFNYAFSFKHIGLAFEIDQSVPRRVKTDYQRLVQLITNLVANALKFSDQGYVFIKIKSPQPNELQFTIQDEGVGMNKEQQQIIQQIINQEQNLPQDWKGFGLMICQMLVRYLGPVDKDNNISIISDGASMGTIVQFTICNHIATLEQQPAVSPHRQQQRQKSMPVLKAEYGLMINIKTKSPSKIILSKTVIEGENCDESSGSIKGQDIQKTVRRYTSKHKTIEKLNTQQYQYTQNTRTKISTKSTSFSQTNLCCNQILSVDDEVFNQRSLQLLLKQQGLEVDTVFNGKQAIERVLNPTKCSPQCVGYKLILMDCQMPVMDGWEATRRLVDMMKNKQIPQIPIIGLTAFTSQFDIQRCVEAGMIDILHKPLEIKRFEQLLYRLRIN